MRPSKEIEWKWIHKPIIGDVEDPLVNYGRDTWRWDKKLAALEDPKKSILRYNADPSGGNDPKYNCSGLLGFYVEGQILGQPLPTFYEHLYIVYSMERLVHDISDHRNTHLGDSLPPKSHEGKFGMDFGIIDDRTLEFKRVRRSGNIMASQYSLWMDGNGKVVTRTVYGRKVKAGDTETDTFGRVTTYIAKPRALLDKEAFLAACRKFAGENPVEGVGLQK